MNQKFIDIARDELGETETKKEQSLAHLRSWLSKHPFLSKIRQDDVHLLQFLRIRKYSMDATFETIENYYLAQKIYPDFCYFESGEYERIFKMIDSGVVIPLPKRDTDGQMVIFQRWARFDTNIFTSADVLKFIVCCFVVLLEEQENQIAGFRVILDFEGFTMKHLVSPAHLLEFLGFFKNAAIVRQKSAIVINLPSFASYLVDLVKSALREKMEYRIFVLKKPLEEMKNHLEQSILPKELGGVQPLDEMLEEFKKVVIERRHLIHQIISVKIDFKKVPSEKLNPNGTRETFGSFRNLEID